jgi:hypothetical protein
MFGVDPEDMEKLRCHVTAANDDPLAIENEVSTYGEKNPTKEVLLEDRMPNLGACGAQVTFAAFPDGA